LDEKFHVEDTLLAHLEALEWKVLRLEMHQQTPSDTGRRDFSEVVLRDRLAKSLIAINDWMEPDQIEEILGG
jgi:type I site-specific restriction-modification system R (restriction) subunit